MTERDDENQQRLATGWGRKPAKPQPQPHDRTGESTEGPSVEPADRQPETETDTERAADAGAISGQAGTHGSQGLATGDTLGGPGDRDER